MTAHTIAFGSAKGGAGKTIACASIAAILGELGKRVLLIDSDEATHGLTLLYLDVVSQARKYFGTTQARGLFDIRLTTEDIEKLGAKFLTRQELNDAIREKVKNELASNIGIVGISENVYLVPATYYFVDKPQEDRYTILSKLNSLLLLYNLEYDYIIIDAQAGTDVSSQAALSLGVSDEVILVSEFDPLSNAGIERMKVMLGESLSFDRTRILLNKLLPDFIDNFTDFLSVAKYLPPIPWTADVVKAYSKRKLALDFSRGNEYTYSLLQTVREILPSNETELIDKWVEDKANLLREPIASQLKKEQAALESLLEEKRKDTRKKLGYMGALIGVLAFLLSYISFMYYTATENTEYINKITFMLGSAAISVAVYWYAANGTLERVDDKKEMQIKIIESRIRELNYLKKANPKRLFSRNKNSL